MKQTKKTVLHWSGGKDSAVALDRLITSGKFSVDLLLTAVNQNTDRVTMHGVRRDLILRQAESLGFPVEFLKLPENPTMEVYQKVFTDKMNELRERGFEISAFGDIHLEDLKKYRDGLLKGTGLKAVYPIWNMKPLQVTRLFIQKGFKALLICVKREKLEESFLGAELDHQMIERLPDSVDPSGENGEYHSFVYDGPLFNNPVHFEKGSRYSESFQNPNKNKKDKVRFDYLDLI
jgi:uncharacterized protein (TIGR00290 family)